MNAPAKPVTKNPLALAVRDLLAHLAGEGRTAEARQLALQLREIVGLDAADSAWRELYGRGLFDEE